MLKSSIYAGDTRTITIDTPASRMAGPGFVPHLAISNANYYFIIDGVEIPLGYQIIISSAQSSLFATGRYDWVIYLTNANERITIDSGTVQVQPNPATALPVDRRSHARKMLDAIEALLEGRATNGDLDLIKIQVPGARRADFDPAQLLPMRDKYRAEVVSEERAAAAARGDRINNTLKVRFQ